MRPDVARASEPLRPIDRRPEGQPGDGPTLGTFINCRQTLSFRTSSRTCLVRRANCSSVVASIPQQGLDEFHRQGIVTGEGAYASGKGRATRRAEFEAGLPQQCPHHVLDRSHLVQDREARHQQRATAGTAGS